MFTHRFAFQFAFMKRLNVNYLQMFAHVPFSSFAAWTEQTRPQISPARYRLKFKFSTAHRSSWIFAKLTFKEIFKSLVSSKGPDILIQCVIVIASSCPVKKECIQTMLECRDANLTVKKVVQSGGPPIKRHKRHKISKYFPHRHIIRIAREIYGPFGRLGDLVCIRETPG